MVKHTQTIRRLMPASYFSVFDHFVGSVLKGLKGLGFRNLSSKRYKFFPKNIAYDYIYQLVRLLIQMIYDSKDIFKIVLLLIVIM